MITASDILDMASIVASKKKMKLSTISSHIFNDGKKLTAIQENGADLTLVRARQALGWLSQNWPSDIEWPANIERPAIADGAAA